MRTLITEFVVTEKCNLSCEYCYMKNRNIFMTKDDVDFFIDKVGYFLNKYHCNNYHISYFGGEPLLNFDIIKYSSEKFRQDNRFKNDTIITNFLLLDDEKIDFIQKQKIGLSLSFDGLWNDFNRTTVNKKPTKEEYIDKIKYLRSKGINNGFKTMVSPECVSTLTENFLFFVNELGLTFIDFSLVRDDIWNETDIENFEKELVRLNNTLIDFHKKGFFVVHGLFYLYFVDIIVSGKYGKRPFGCFAGCKGIGYFPGKKFYPCARFGANKEYLLADESGVYEDNINFLRQEKICNPQKYDKCKKCPIYTYCNAGCTYSQMLNNFEPVESVCNLLKISYKETIRVYNELKKIPHSIEHIMKMINNFIEKNNKQKENTYEHKKIRSSRSIVTNF